MVSSRESLWARAARLEISLPHQKKLRQTACPCTGLANSWLLQRCYRKKKKRGTERIEGIARESGIQSDKWKNIG